MQRDGEGQMSQQGIVQTLSPYWMPLFAAVLAKILVPSLSPLPCRMRGELLLVVAKLTSCKSIILSLTYITQKELQSQACIPESWHDVQLVNPSS